MEKLMPADASGTPVRIAAVRYLNTLPLIDGLDKLAGLHLLKAVPSQIAGMVGRGEADIGLASVVDALASVGTPGPLALLPVGMIGCDGPTLTVRLFSTVPMDQITTLHADTDSHTSVALARIVLEKLHGVRPRIEDFDVAQRIALTLTTRRPVPVDLENAWPQALLMIGDKVVTDSPPQGRYPHQLDLGQAWKQLTGLPFVYAMWTCLESRIDDPRIALGAALLERQRRHNATRQGWLARTHAPEHRWPTELAQHYLGTLLRYAPGPRELEGIATFARLAREVGLVLGGGGGEMPRIADPAHLAMVASRA